MVPAPGRGEGRDRLLEHRPRWIRWPKWALVVPAAAAAGLILVLSQASARGGLRVDRQAVTVAEVRRDVLQETVAGQGVVVPGKTIFLDLAQGGRIEEIYILEGAMVERGQPLVRLTNSDLELRAIQANAQRVEQINALRDSRFRLEQGALDGERELADLDYQIRSLERRLERNQKLMQEAVIARQEVEQAQDELDFYRHRKALALQASRQNAARVAQQIRQLEASVAMMEASYDVIRRSLESLFVQAPASGQMTSLKAEIGQLLPAGARLGQIDVLQGGYRVRASFDEYYSGRIAAGQGAVAQLAGKPQGLRVARVYPEVREGRFEADLEFAGAAPAGLRPGQTLGFQLSMGVPGEALVIPRGAFFEKTGGHWIYVLDGADEARKREIRLGRQSTTSVEVLEGVAKGDRVIVSSYEPFGEAERILLK